MILRRDFHWCPLFKKNLYLGMLDIKRCHLTSTTWLHQNLPIQTLFFGVGDGTIKKNKKKNRFIPKLAVLFCVAIEVCGWGGGYGE